MACVISFSKVEVYFVHGCGHGMSVEDDKKKGRKYEELTEVLPDCRIFSENLFSNINYCREVVKKRQYV